jgi:phenylacetic acid degradation operon negative regulatory protein
MRIPIEKIILSTVAAVGVVAIVLITPGIGPVLKMFGVKKSYKPYYINKAIKRANEKGYITYISKNGKQYARLTKKGRLRLNEYKNEDVVSIKNKRKTRDGKWHIVIFDIKEKRRTTRNKMRRQLVSAGFIKLQNSVWISPYVADEFVSLLKADNHIGKDVIYIRADHVENENNLKKYFI